MRSRTQAASAEAQRAALERLRFDKWLWAARFYKTRSLAAQAIESGQARIGGERVKPAHLVRKGDRVAVRKQTLVFEVEVADLCDRRGSASEAIRLYVESEESLRAREQAIAERTAAARSRLPGRPSKRDRRRLQAFLDEP
jgi:ribosome-associated heat shock protein Hsp15